MQATVAHKQNRLFNICVNFGGGFGMKHAFHPRKTQAASKLQGCIFSALILKGISQSFSPLCHCYSQQTSSPYTSVKKNQGDKLQNFTAEALEKNKKLPTATHILRTKSTHSGWKKAQLSPAFRC
jgi:hypothetical protein